MTGGAVGGTAEMGATRNKVQSTKCYWGREETSLWEESEKTMIFNLGLVSLHPPWFSK